MDSKIVILFLLLISCTTDEDMRIIQSNLSGVVESVQTTLKIKMTEGDQSETYISSELLGKELKQRIEIFKNTDDNALPNVLDYSDVYLGSDKVKIGGEDCAPYRILNTTIGGNHGYFSSKATSSGHGKTQVDVGSIWNDGTNDRTIWGVDDENVLWLDGGPAAGLTMTHVSGATNTGSFTVTSESFRQFYPVTNNHSMVLKIDGSEVAIATGEHEAGSDIVIEESYDILRASDIRAYLHANVGSVPANVEFDVPGVARVTNKVRYTRYGNTLENDFEVLPAGNGLAFQDIMFVMGFELVASTTYPNLRTYIPKTLPFSQDGSTWDFANIEDQGDNISYVNRINITPGRADASGQLADRHIYLLDGLGFSMGFLPIDDADPAVRRTRANNKAMQLSTQGKVYMSAIDDDGKSTMTTGDYYKTTSYKVFFESVTNRTTYYIIDADNGDYYLYADWHNLPYSDTLDIPLDLVGKTIGLVEASVNVSYTGGYIGSTLDVEITDSESYGYLILKLS